MRMRASWCAVSGLIVGLVVLGLTMPGCEPPAPQKTGKKTRAKTEPVKTGEKTVTVEEKTVTKTEVKTEEATPAKTEEKTVTKTDEKTEAKTEVKTEEKTVAKTEEKTMAKTEEKTEAKTEEKTVAKTEEKTMAKTEVKTEEKTPAKTEEKKTEMKTETPVKTEEKKTEEKKIEAKTEVKTEEKTIEKKTEAKTEEKPVAVPPRPAGVEPPAVPKISTFAPAEDLVKQAKKYVDDLDKATANEEDYKTESEAKSITRNGDLLALAALALALHDEANDLKANAPAIYEAAKKVAATKDYAGAKAAVADLKAAVEGKNKSSAELKWTDVASLGPFWNQAESLKIKLPSKPEKFKAKTAPGNTAMLALIGQAAIFRPVAQKPEELKTPADYKKWDDFSIQMRDLAAAANKDAHNNDAAAVVAGKDKLDKNCNDCHALFRKEEPKKEPGKEEKEEK
jgi:hypothetical protein